MKDLEERLERREKMALKLADMLNEKIDECEKRKATEVDLAVQLSAKIDECEKLKEELAHYKYLYKVVSLHEEA